MTRAETRKRLQEAIEEQAPRCRWTPDEALDAMLLRWLVLESKVAAFIRAYRRGIA